MPYEEVPYFGNFWIHEKWEHTGEFDDDNYPVQVLSSTHSGRKEKCQECRKQGEIESFANSLTDKGTILFLVILMLFLLGVTVIVGVFLY